MAIITEIDSDSSDSESTLGYSTAAEGVVQDQSPSSESVPAELSPAEFIESALDVNPAIEAEPDQCSSELVPISSVGESITSEELDRTTKTTALTGGGKHLELSGRHCDNNNYLEEATSSMSLDRPLRIPAPSLQPSFRNQISRRYSFLELMQAALTAIFAVVLSWRLFLFPSRNGSSSSNSTSAIEGSSRSVDDPEAPPVREAARQTSEDTRLLEAGLVMSSEETPPSPVRGPSSVLSLLSTDAMPESSSSDGEDRPPPPMPSLLQPVPLPAYLDTINEEESDDLRSISSASFLSPRSNADRLSIDPQNRSETISDSDYRSPVAPSPIVIIPKEALEDEDEEEEEVQTPKEDDEHTEVEQVDKSIGAPSPGILDSSVDSADVTVIERVTVSESDEEELIEEPVGSVENVVDDKSKVAQLITTERKEESKEATTDLLKGLAKLGQESQIRTIAEAEGQSEPAVSEKEPVEPQIMSTETVRTIPVEETHSAKESRLVEQQHLYDVVPADVTLPTPQDADRDQGEELFFNEERRKTVTMDDSLSLNSVSINLNNTKDSLLDRSLADNITDEAAVMQSSMQFKEPLSTQRPSYRPPSPPTDLPPPPPPPPPPPHTGGAIPPAPLLTAPPAPPPPAFPTTAPPPPPLFASTSSSVSSSAASSARLPPPSPPKFTPAAEILRRAQDLATDDIPQQFAPEVPRHTAPANVAGTFSSRSSESGPPSEAPPPPPPIQSLPTPPSFATNYSTTSNFGQADLLQRNMIDSARRMYNPYDRADQGMSSPPIDAPPPPPPVYSVKSGHSSREDLLGDVGGRDAGNTTSRSTVREIPVHRAPSAAPSNSTVTVLDYRMPTTTYPPPLDGQDEYYRREVLTRTIITRSTDALNQQPLGRSSPIERYISYPDPNTREERTVDYKVTYHRNIEEEERRIREEQDRRRQEEEDRRRREQESRRQWELREREVLENMRLVRERKEKEVELSIRDRERLEKDRIDKDRAARERAEMQRRADWERMEDERRRLEEDELTRRRRLEKERLEKERLEMERLERERLERERERLERERLEAERKEAERLERIRIERERIERERIEIERIERIKKERIERERKEKEKEREEQERLRREREELERIERERREIEIREREELERARREAEEREKQRLEDEAKEARRREEERREQLLLEDIQRQAEERERLRRQQEREEQERLDRIRREQQRLEQERADADRRERERAEEERRERELLEAAQRKKAERDRERLEEAERERVRQEEERRERDRHEAERRAAAERERQRREEEDRERQKLLDLERAAAERRALRAAEIDRERERDELDRKARELAELERRENERRERERRDEERSLMELREKEKRNQEIRDRERQEAAEREATRRLDDRRSRDKLDILVRERSEKERFEAEKRRLLQEKEQMSRRRNHLTSSETLQKLTKPPYYSRDNLNTEVTTKVEREVIERVDRNVWVDDRLYPIGSTQPAISYSLDSTQEDAHRDRLYNPRDLDRTGSGRTSKYHRSKMEKARRDFFTGGPDSADPAERFRKSVDDLNSSTRGRPEFRGPLLQKFHEGEFKSRENVDMPYSRVGPSPYSQEFEKLLRETEEKYAQYRERMSQPNLFARPRYLSNSYLETDVDTGRPDIGSRVREVEETNLDEVHRRSGSVVDYHRQSRRDVAEESAEPVHTRSRSADYLMDRRLREETAPPENELQKTMGETSPRHSKMSEAEMRFHKSTEKLTVPDWYRDSRKTARPTDLDSTMPRTGWESRAEPERYELSYPQPSYYQPYHQSPTSTTPTGIDIPRGMFDKYKEEIADMRRSRTSIHQLGMDAPTPAPQRQEERPSPAPRRSLSQETISSRVLDATSSRALPGYTVSQVPAEWNVTRTRSSRVIEVADTFVGTKQPVDGKVSLRYGGRVTIEEVLDSIFQHTPPSPVRHRHISGPQADEVYQGSPEAPGIYSQNYNLMEQVIRNPEQAEDLLKSEHLFVRCARCYRTRELSQARLQYVSCKYCYTYYCSRECRQDDWPKHNTRCSFARINTLCKDVIMKVREDAQAQAFMSRIAREGYSASGRGSVNIRLASPQLAQAYVTNGWQALAHAPLQQLLYYYTVEALVQERKEPSLIALCRRYDPREKFILSVSIIADIEHCPETPPPETTYPDSQFQSPTQRYDPYQEASSFYAPPVYATTPLTLVPTDV